MAHSPHPVPAHYLVTGQPFDGSIRVESEQDKAVFGTLFVLERGRAIDVQLVYHLPSAVDWSEDGGRYSLIVQKQSGAKPRSATVTLNWPEGYALLSTNLSPIYSESGRATFEFSLSHDQEILAAWTRE
jgi:hypothetical protein